MCFPAGQGTQTGQAPAPGTEGPLNGGNEPNGWVTRPGRNAAAAQLLIDCPPGVGPYFWCESPHNQGSSHTGIASCKREHTAAAHGPAAQRAELALLPPAPLLPQHLESTMSEKWFPFIQTQGSAWDCADTPYIWETTISVAPLGLSVQVGRSSAIEDHTTKQDRP